MWRHFALRSLVALAALATALAAGPGAVVAPEPTGPGVSLMGEHPCDEAGYLCTAMGSQGWFQVRRWPDEVRTLRVRIVPPADESPSQAAALQQAAARGVMAWRGNPLDIVVYEREGDGDPVHIELTWVRQLPAPRLGETRTYWNDRVGPPSFGVPVFVLATRSPYDAEEVLSGEAIALVAAHEMGHALGLPHSDSQDDLMYPSNLASRLSDRDLVTVRALYAVPPGTVLRGGDAAGSRR